MPPASLKLNLIQANQKYRLGAVSYFNTTPLVWGMLHGEERDLVDLSFSKPAQCALDVERGTVQIGLVPVAEAARQGLQPVPGVGIACRGAVRSILLFSRKPWRDIRTLAADENSRSSVQLARVILREKYGAEPAITPASPVLNEMLSASDAALVIGDPALRIQPETTGYDWLDLGSEWFGLTKLPMVFAVWAGKPPLPVKELQALTSASWKYGEARIDEIVEREYQRRGISRELATEYLRRNIRFEIGPAEQRGLETYLELAGLSVGVSR